MPDNQILKDKLKSIAGKDYGAYQSLKGDYDFTDAFRLDIYQIPKDPYAPPHTGIYRIQVNRNDERIINFDFSTKTQEIALRDFLARRFFHACEDISTVRRGTGFSGVITINQPGQANLDRNCVKINDQTIEIRCFIGLPASGRLIDAEIAKTMLFDELPRIVEQALFKKHLNPKELLQHIETAEDSEHLRSKLDSLGIVAFIANNSILPRQSGTSDQPMSGTSAVPFVSPESLQVKIECPHAGLINGMGIPKGVTLIVGGGYHGKSTLLEALETGCYNHIPGDGRERCVSHPAIVKVRAYSGRSIVKTDISPFIGNLPFKKNTTGFSSDNASGSTSQAASIIEAIEVGAEILLMDEDTCATNFMIRDSKMQQLVIKENEPITTYIDKVRQLFEEKQISTILVLGGVGDYFDVSDSVIQMINYQPANVTVEAREISKKALQKRVTESTKIPFQLTDRIPLAESVSPYNQYGKKSIYAKEVNRLYFGKEVIDLTDLEQLIELSQTKALGCALDYAIKYMDENTSLKEVIDKVMNDIDSLGLDILSDRISGHFAEFRAFELAFALNRLRNFSVKQKL